MIRASLFLLCLPFFLLSFALSGVRLLSLYAPGQAEAIAWLDPDDALRTQRALFQTNMDPALPYLVSPRQQMLLARLSPLDTLPFMPPLVQASADRDLEAMQTLSEHVLHLDPRNRAARFVAAQLAVAREQPQAAMQALVPLLALDRQNSAAYLAEMASIAATAEGRQVLLDALSSRPPWGAGLVRRLAQSTVDTDFLLSLLDLYPEGQSSFVQALVRRGDLERAHLTFLNFLPLDLVTRIGVPFDRQFRGTDGAQPFNWVINRTYANLEKAGGLSVSFFGQGRPIIAEQILRLSPGPYRADFVMNGELFQNGGHFDWSLECTRTGEPLMTRPIIELLSSPTNHEALFDVPGNGCSFQTLRLRGVAGAFPRTSRATVTEVNISHLRAE